MANEMIEEEGLNALRQSQAGDVVVDGGAHAGALPIRVLRRQGRRT